MSQRLVIRPWAKLDLADAALFYEQRRSGLGDEFLAAVKTRLNDVRERPGSFPIAYKNDLRRALVNRFPYAIWFLKSLTATVVLGILHTSRDHRRLLRKRG